MEKYFLDNYKISKSQVIQSLFVSEYGLRHWFHAKKQTSYKWEHRIIAIIELCPLIGLVATVIEGLIARCLLSNTAEPLFDIPTFFENFLKKKRAWLFKGSQAGSDGPVLQAKVESIRAKLDAFRPIGIQFNKKKLAPSLRGGTCSAMSLEFLDDYFKTKKISTQQTNTQSITLVKLLGELAQKFSSSSQEMRHRQSAYNTIEIQPHDSKVDHSKNKVQSLANYHSFIVDYCSSEIDVNQLHNENLIAKEVEALPEGAFFVRVLRPANNEKLEKYGHSLVYIKEQDLSLLYDPNYGAIHLPSSKHCEILFKTCRNLLRLFKINKARFYRLRPS